MRLLSRARRQAEAPRPRPAEAFLAAGARQSRALGHDYVGTEHVLLALTEDRETPAARALARLGLPREVVRRDIEHIIGTCVDPRRRAIDPEALATLGIDLDEVTRRVEETFGPGALDSARAGALDGVCRSVARQLKQALELAVTEAGDGPVRPEHILLSLATVEDSVAAQIFDRHGITLDKLRAALSDDDPDPIAA